MRAAWLGRSAGTACAVAGCMPMLFAVLAGLTGAAGAQAVNAGMAVGMMPAAPAEPGWIATLGALSWPLLVVSVALLLWGFRGAAPLSRRVSWVGVAFLIANQLAMTPWLFFPGIGLIAVALAVARPRAAGPAPTATVAGEAFPPAHR